MPRRIAIVGGSPIWRRGVGAGLADADFAAVELASLGDWKIGRSGVAVVLAVELPDEIDVVSAFCDEQPHIPVIAVVSDLTVSVFAELVRAGALMVIDEGEEVDDLVEAVRVALTGFAMVPESMVRSLAARVPRSLDPGEWLIDGELDWVRALAAGTPVADLADSVGYSEREMYRSLKDLYQRVGVSNRTEAIVWATRMGVLDDDGHVTSR